MSRIVSRSGMAAALLALVMGAALLPAPVDGQADPLFPGGLICDEAGTYPFPYQGAVYRVERWSCIDEQVSPSGVPPVVEGQFGFCTPVVVFAPGVSGLSCSWGDARDPLGVLRLPGSHYCVVTRTGLTYDDYGYATLGCLPRAVALRAIFNR